MVRCISLTNRASDGKTVSLISTAYEASRDKRTQSKRRPNANFNLLVLTRFFALEIYNTGYVRAPIVEVVK